MRTGGDAFAIRLADARAGDPAAWLALYDLVAPVVRAYLHAQALPDPDDVAGETLLQVVRDLHRFDGTERQFVSWTLAIAHHRMIDARRSLQRRPSSPYPNDALPDEQAPDETAAAVLADAEWSDVASVLAVLTDDQREVVGLRVVGGLTLEETAAALERTVGSVKALQHRAFRALREHVTSSRNPEATVDAHRV